MANVREDFEAWFDAGMSSEYVREISWAAYQAATERAARICEQIGQPDYGPDYAAKIREGM